MSVFFLRALQGSAHIAGRSMAMLLSTASSCLLQSNRRHKGFLDAEQRQDEHQNHTENRPYSIFQCRPAAFHVAHHASLYIPLIMYSDGLQSKWVMDSHPITKMTFPKIRSLGIVPISDKRLSIAMERLSPITKYWPTDTL